jgi:hypothetical protein
MINLIILITIFIIFIFLEFVQMPDEIKTTFNFVLLSATLSYISLNIDNVSLSKYLFILSIISILLIPVVLIIKYMEKLKN